MFKNFLTGLGFVVFTTISLTSLLIILIIAGVFIKHLGIHLWDMCKHMIPKWQYEQDYIDECKTAIKNATDNDWRKGIILIQKGRLVIFYDPHEKYFKRQYALIKRCHDK